MKKAGRAIIPLLVAALCIGGFFLIFFVAGDSPMSVADEFMLALAKGDAKQLTRLGYMEGVSPQQEEALWKTTLDRSEYFRFAWQVKNSTQSTPSTATVTMDYQKNTDSPSSYSEAYSLPMIKVDGKWKVEVRQISRDMYPSLPR